MNTETIYIPKELVLEQHGYIIAVSGGCPNIYPEKEGLLDSILEHIQNDDYFPTFLEKLQKLMLGIACYHIFMDGNKRTAIAMGALFLELNGYSKTIISRFLMEMENYIIWAVEHRVSEEILHKKLEYIIYNIDEPDEFKLQIINILTN